MREEIAAVYSKLKLIARVWRSNPFPHGGEAPLIRCISLIYIDFSLSRSTGYLRSHCVDVFIDMSFPGALSEMMYLS